MSLFAPASTLWLLKNELKLGLRMLTPARKAGAKGPGVWFWVRIALFTGLVVAIVALLGVPAALWMHRRGFQPSAPYYLLLDVGGLAVFTLMLAQALNTATQVLYERNDLDLLLSSPVPAGRILTVRGLGMALLASALYLVLASLIVVPLALVGEARWLAALVVILCMGLLAAAGGLLLAMGLFAVLGPKRTRLAAQVLAAVIGVSIFLVSQARNFLPHAALAGIERGSRRSRTARWAPPRRSRGSGARWRASRRRSSWRWLWAPPPSCWSRAFWAGASATTRRPPLRWATPRPAPRPGAAQAPTG